MKIRETFVMREVAQTWIVVPVADPSSDALAGFWRLSASGALLWRTLEKGCEMEDLVRVLTETYHVAQDIARTDAQQFVQKLEHMGCLEP